MILHILPLTYCILYSKMVAQDKRMELKHHVTKKAIYMLQAFTWVTHTKHLCYSYRNVQNKQLYTNLRHLHNHHHPNLCTEKKKHTQYIEWPLQVNIGPILFMHFSSINFIIVPGVHEWSELYSLHFNTSISPPQ